MFERKRKLNLWEVYLLYKPCLWYFILSLSKGFTSLLFNPKSNNIQGGLYPHPTPLTIFRKVYIPPTPLKIFRDDYIPIHPLKNIQGGLYPPHPLNNIQGGLYPSHAFNNIQGGLYPPHPINNIQWGLYHLNNIQGGLYPPHPLNNIQGGLYPTHPLNHILGGICLLLISIIFRKENFPQISPTIRRNLISNTGYGDTDLLFLAMASFQFGPRRNAKFIIYYFWKKKVFTFVVVLPWAPFNIFNQTY